MGRGEERIREMRVMAEVNSCLRMEKVALGLGED